MQSNLLINEPAVLAIFSFPNTTKSVEHVGVCLSRRHSRVRWSFRRRPEAFTVPHFPAHTAIPIWPAATATAGRSLDDCNAWFQQREKCTLVVEP
ncbi:unnamed protein product [Protopolystoma xenopodis]|uniref:Uncharacterized protein n=1 Tax=Protopolystoma xenopodis TaxID=117903 RepID=A0A448XKZ8_9PLAT|nr:unnamed protein product [Protopolystoma xenopodis]